MNIALITPAGRQSRAGNRATATRWARFLRRLGHRVQVAETWDERGAGLMIALHAWRSADSIRRFSDRHPGRPLIVTLTGTDIYHFQHSDPEVTLDSMDRAHALIGLHDRVHRDIPARFRRRLHTVFQSAEPLPRRLPPVKSWFDVCVAGHLREEKDSLRAAYAVRDVPDNSRLRVIHVGKPHDSEWEAAARTEDRDNPRFRWKGEVPHGEVRRLMARARLMVMSSVMEGGANVVSEACVAGLPVIASDISGNRGLLGDDYPGYYPARDTEALRERLLQAERDPDYLESLRAHCASLAPLFRPEAERDGLARVVDRVSPPG
ncbi:selenoneine biosynthesis selenosugar synthase SenB [Aquisalimonas lutea]|uniref:selenoneine biosynthesis selenosugar synthase SenB n=1 Tax=Aquisalimonas lutea TaxID=1327750 RepID=UPI0025B2AEB9|nr:selenoneine biosynthesis selenosugar synthase SenB [Aquisalimonas lutea]MDN3518966.1 selenoneine biosynthesis selenosugar synthase SenB [Aquisalimonas lutea]